MLHHLLIVFSYSRHFCQLLHSGSPCWQCYSTCCCLQCMGRRCLWFGHSSRCYPSSWGGTQFLLHIYCIGCVDTFLNWCWILLKTRYLMSKVKLHCQYACDWARQLDFISLPLNFVCMFLIALLRRSVCVFTTIIRIPSHQFWVPLMFVCFMINPHIVLSSLLKLPWKSFW